MGDAWLVGAGALVGPSNGLELLSRNSAWTSMPGIDQNGNQLGRSNMSTSTFLEENSLEKRVLVPEHQTLVRGAAVILLEGLQAFLVVFDGIFELLDVLRAPLAESSLSLSVALFAFL